MISFSQLSTINYQLAKRQRPDYDLPRRCASAAGVANHFLIKARREMANLNPL